MIPLEAKCRQGILHDFEISRDLPDALIEICRLCGEKAIYYKNKGRIDDFKYSQANMRATLQPYGRTGKLFRQIYGTKSIGIAENYGKNKKKRQDEKEELREKRIFMRYQAFKGSKTKKEVAKEIDNLKSKTTGLQNVG